MRLLPRAPSKRTSAAPETTSQAVETAPGESTALDPALKRHLRQLETEFRRSRRYVRGLTLLGGSLCLFCSTLVFRFGWQYFHKGQVKDDPAGVAMLVLILSIGALLGAELFQQRVREIQQRLDQLRAAGSTGRSRPHPLPTRPAAQPWGPDLERFRAARRADRLTRMRKLDRLLPQVESLRTAMPDGWWYGAIPGTLFAAFLMGTPGSYQERSAWAIGLGVGLFLLFVLGHKFFKRWDRQLQQMKADLAEEIRQEELQRPT